MVLPRDEAISRDQQLAGLAVIERSVLAGWRIAFVLGCPLAAYTVYSVLSPAAQSSLWWVTHPSSLGVARLAAALLVWALAALALGTTYMVPWVAAALRGGPDGASKLLKSYEDTLASRSARPRPRKTTRADWALAGLFLAGFAISFGALYAVFSPLGPAGGLAAASLAASALTGGPILSWYTVVAAWLQRRHGLALPWRERLRAWSPLVVVWEVASQRIGPLRAMWSSAFGESKPSDEADREEHGG
jgi:hypothetical protein